MSTPFYQPGSGADEQGNNPDPQAGNYPNQQQQWGHNPGAQPPQGYPHQVPYTVPHPPAQPQWGSSPAPQNYNMGMQQFGQPQYPVQQKSMVLAAVLAFFLGTLGVHNFYLGHTKTGMAQLALTIMGYILAIVLVGFVFLFAVGLWVFIEFVLILMRSGRFSTDSRGVPLQ